MSGKQIAAVVGTILLAAVGLLMAQPGGGGRRTGPPPDPMGQWLDDLDKAHAEKDVARVGELIAEMKERRQQFGRRMGGPDFPGGPGPGGRRGPVAAGDIGSTPLAKGQAETRILAVLDEMDRNQRGGNMNVPIQDGRLLRLLAEALDAKTIVEIGTSNGYSGIWQTLALRSTGGRLITFEIDTRRAAMARENFKRAAVDDLVTLVEGDAHEKVQDLEGPIDILFLDADKEGYIDYLNKLLGKVRPGGLVIGHNINPRQADPRYLEAITANPDLETIFLNDGGGVSVTLKKRPR